jgi:2',3'-cyclic-nucleotide 2'-phosphodiesterase (5'-nucleotidase family)
MRRRVEADVALLNSGGIRGNRVVQAGTLTRRHMREILPFSNVIVLLEVDGSVIARALERSVDVLPRPSGHYLQTAGLAYQVDLDQPAGRRVRDVVVGDAPLDPRRRYRVATLEYLAEGKDGYAMLREGKVLRGAEDGPGLVESVLAALEAGQSPTPDGRSPR